jgi:hypothetical protein
VVVAGAVREHDVRGLLSLTDAEFALATYVATHDAVDGARGVVEGALAADRRASTAKRDALDAAMPDGDPQEPL